MLDQLRSFFNLAEIGQSRSSIANPLQWLIVVLIAGIVLMSLCHVVPWVVLSLVVCLLIVFILFIYAYLYFMHTKPDVLRSEHFHLSKLAIERGLIGDDIQGLFEEDPLPSPRPIDGRQLPGGKENE